MRRPPLSSSPWRLAVLLALALSTLGWFGSGHGVVQWSAGEAKQLNEQARLPIDAVGSLAQGEMVVAMTIALPGPAGDGVLTIGFHPRLFGQGWVDLPSPYVDIAYDEYSLNGDLLFTARKGEGRLRLQSGIYRVDAELSLELSMADEQSDEGWRRLERIELVVEPAELPDPVAGDSDHSTGFVPVASGGCDAGWDDEEDDEWDSDDSGGCEGDDLSASESDSGGCEGDDVGGADAGGCDGCDGDAIAGSSCPRPRRNVWVARIVNWMPYAIVFFGLRLFRRRRQLF